MLFCVFEHFTEQARRVVVSAQEHARDLNHGYIGSEHLLLAVASDGGEVPTELLGAVGVNVNTVRAAVIKRVGVGEERRPDGFIPFTPRAKRAFELAGRESSELGHSDVSSGHVLLGLMRLRDGMAVRVLVDLDVPWEQLGAGLLTRLKASGAEEGLRLSVDARGPRSLAPRDGPHRGGGARVPGSSSGDLYSGTCM
jgi:ATP-dependent Clp protease ATP-binding subunit ClpC